MFNSLGMSESILMLIERRSRADMIIFCCLVVVTLGLIYGLCQYKWGSPLEDPIDPMPTDNTNSWADYN